MSLVDHARTELDLCGQTASDPAYAQSLICAIAALATYGHSGGSMGCAIHQLHELLQFRPLSPLTDDPGEWVEVGDGMWQNRRDSAAFSYNGGATYRYVDDRKDEGTHLAVEVRRKREAPAAHARAMAVGQDKCAPGPVADDDTYPPLTSYVACDRCEASGSNCPRHRTPQQVADDAERCSCGGDPARSCSLPYDPHPGMPG